MVSFKLCIANPKTGKCYQKEAKDTEAQGFIGLNIGEKITGDGFGMGGYEFLITGGSDYCGFPMRHGILGIRKKIYSYSGVGFPGLKKGEKTRKTVCGHKINENVTQINLKMLKEGAKKIEELMPVGEKKEEGAGEAPKKEAKVEEKKEAPKKEKVNRIKDSKYPSGTKAEKPEEKPKEIPKAEDIVPNSLGKAQTKPKEEKKEAPKEEKPKEAPKEEKK